MDRRRRQLGGGETADQRLDRLIEMERRSKLLTPDVPEVRRLKVDEGEMAASGSAPRPGDRHGEGEHGAAQERMIPLQLEAEVPAQDGLLAPLFQEFGREDVQGAHGVFHRRLDEDDDTHPAVAVEPEPSAAGAGLELARNLSSDAGREQGFVHRDGTSLLVASTGLFGQERGGAGVMAVPPGVNAFWSAGVQRAAVLEQVADVARPESLPPLAGAPVTFGPAGHGGAGHGHSGASPGQAARGSAGLEQALGAGALHGGGPGRRSSTWGSCAGPWCWSSTWRPWAGPWCRSSTWGLSRPKGR